MPIVVNTQEAKTQLSRLLKEVAAGNEVVIANRDTPIARLTPYEQPTKRRLGFVKGSLPESFFDALPDEDIALWGLQQ